MQLNVLLENFKIFWRQARDWRFSGNWRHLSPAGEVLKAEGAKTRPINTLIFRCEVVN